MRRALFVIDHIVINVVLIFPTSSRGTARDRLGGGGRRIRAAVEEYDRKTPPKHGRNFRRCRSDLRAVGQYHTATQSLASGWRPPSSADRGSASSHLGWRSLVLASIEQTIRPSPDGRRATSDGSGKRRWLSLACHDMKNLPTTMSYFDIDILPLEFSWS